MDKPRAAIDCIVRCYKQGDFKLASGKRSNEYIDLKPAILHPSSLFLFATCFWEKLQEFVPPWGDDAKRPIAVCGPPMGGIPLAVAMSIVFWNDSVLTTPVLLVRDKPKEHGAGVGQRVDGVNAIDPPGFVIVTEDVVTTGGSTMRTIEALREVGLDHFLVFALVDREEGAAKRFHEENVCFAALITLAGVRESYARRNGTPATPPVPGTLFEAF